MRLSKHKQRGHSSSAYPTMDGLLVLEGGWVARLWGWMDGCSGSQVDGLLRFTGGWADAQ